MRRGGEEAILLSPPNECVYLENGFNRLLPQLLASKAISFRSYSGAISIAEPTQHREINVACLAPGLAGCASDL